MIDATNIDTTSATKDSHKIRFTSVNAFCYTLRVYLETIKPDCVESHALFQFKGFRNTKT